MTAYFILYVIVLLSSSLVTQVNSKKYLIFISIILTIFSGLRYDVGVDYISYENMFLGIQGYAPNEPGLAWLISIFQKIGVRPQMIFLLFSVVIQIALYKSLSHFQSNYSISIMIFLCVAPFYLGSFNGIRQFLAIVLIYSIIHLLEKKDYLKFSIYIILISLFVHLTAIIMLPIALVSIKKLNRIKKIIIAIIIFLSISTILTLLQYTTYGKYLDMQAVNSTPSLFSYLFIAISLIIFLIEPFVKYYRYKDFLFNMNFYAGIFALLAILFSSSYIGQMLMRVTNYFFFSYVFLIPLIIEYIFRTNVKYLIYGFVIITVSVYYFVTIIVNGEEHNLVPYTINFKII